MAARTEPPGRGNGTEATIQFLAENRDMASVASLMAQDGGPAPVDMHAYTATLQIAERPAPARPQRPQRELMTERY